MKKLSIYFLIGMFVAFSSCKKDDPVTDTNSNTNQNDGEENNSDSNYKWDYKINVKSDIVVDQQDNVYFVACDNNDAYSVYSLDKSGNKNWSTALI